MVGDLGVGRSVLTGDFSSEIRQLPYVTPSRAFALETCFLRVAFDAGLNHAGDIFRGPKARLGSASHAVLERASKHGFDHVPKEERRYHLRRVWDEEARKEGDAAQNSELEKHFGPPERWPGYNIQKARAVAAALGKLERQDRATGGSGGSALAERSYSAYGGRLRGRADAVYSRGGHTEIEDYKTGNIYDEVPGTGLMLKPHLRKQIMLYAAMHHDETGEWPAAGSIVPLVGSKERVPVEPVEAGQEASVALSMLESYNQKVRTPGIQLEALASPSPAACGFCNHKLVCTPFWKQVSPKWTWTGGEAIRGTVLRLATSGAGTWHGEISASGGTLETGNYPISGSRQVPLVGGKDFLATGVKAIERQEIASLVVTNYTQVRPASRSARV